MGLKFERTDNLDKLFEIICCRSEKNSCAKRRNRSVSKTATTKRKEKRQETKVR